jgi:beta-lactamase regulating signal transducer with metallopeptidase domain
VCSSDLLAATRSPRVRYIAACAGLLAMIAGFAVVFASHLIPAGSAAPIPVTEALASVTFRGDGPLEPSWPSQVAPWLAPFWFAGALLLQIRNAAGLVIAHRLRRHGVRAVPPEWKQRLADLCRRMTVSKPVAMLESSLVNTPAVVGHLKPLILIPLGLLASLPVDQIEAILLHELAHIRRNDYLVNLCLRVIEGILFYHPATWWLSHLIRHEREHCCDDAAVALSGGNAYAYASALTALEQHRRFAGNPGLAATGGNLMTRIQRLLGAPKPASTNAKPSSVAATLLLAACAITAYAWPQPQAQNPWEKWLAEDVVYIIEAPERAAYQRLASDDERKMFIEQFWLRRDPTPGTPKNERKDEHYRRIAYSNER